MQMFQRENKNPIFFLLNTGYYHLKKLNIVHVTRLHSVDK